MGSGEAVGIGSTLVGAVVAPTTKAHTGFERSHLKEEPTVVTHHPPL
jgi:hypothetical protein